MKNLRDDEVNLLRHNTRNIVRELGLLNEAYFEIGITTAERHLLIELATGGLVTAGEIAQKLLLDKSTISRLIAKARKKGYVKGLSDKIDKRRRFLSLTEKGKKTLNDFEAIAFQQTKKALLTLSEGEIDKVHQGMALFSKGLKIARLNRKGSTILEDDVLYHETLAQVYEQLNQLGYTVKLFCSDDEKAIYEIFLEIIDSDNQFSCKDNSLPEFHRFFFKADSHVFVCHNLKGEVVGAFSIGPNYEGRSDIANAIYMVKASCQGQGIGTLLVKASLHLAKKNGFKAMQFNRVFCQNLIAIRIYQKLGFKIIGAIPEAICNKDGSYQDCYMMYRALNF